MVLSGVAVTGCVVSPSPAQTAVHVDDDPPPFAPTVTTHPIQRRLLLNQRHGGWMFRGDNDRLLNWPYKAGRQTSPFRSERIGTAAEGE